MQVGISLVCMVIIRLLGTEIKLVDLSGYRCISGGLFKVVGLNGQPRLETGKCGSWVDGIEFLYVDFRHAEATDLERIRGRMGVWRSL